jgi:ectoine hydroxylase
MKLMQQRVYEFSKIGYVVLEDRFKEKEVRRIRAFAEHDLSIDSPRRTPEAGIDLIRASHGTHQVEPLFSDLADLPRIPDPVRQLLGGDVYVPQFNFNAKAALGGEPWGRALTSPTRS